MPQALCCDELLPAAGGDPFLRSSLARRPVARAWGRDGAVCWVGEAHPAQLSGLGPPDALAALLAAAPQPLPVRASLPREAAPALARHALALSDPTDWDFRWTASPPPAQPGEDEVSVLGPDRHTDAEVACFLAAVSPTASAQPGDPSVRRWAGVRGADGALLAVAADTSPRPDLGHLSSIATRPDARGRGLGAALTAALTRWLFTEGAELVTLGLYAVNGTARRLYTRLGFQDEHRMRSGLLTLRGEPVVASSQLLVEPGVESMPASER